MLDSKTLVLITARSGSKGVPGKNILPFGSENPITLRVKSARLALPDADVVMSTDSEHYASIASRFGARAPFIRPNHLASDEASSKDVILHALHELRRLGCSYEYLILAEPSSPFCRPEDLRQGFGMLERTKKPVVAVKEVSPNPLFITPMGQDGQFGELANRLGRPDLRRQAFEKSFTPNGCFYGVTVSDYLENGTFYTKDTLAFEMPQEYSLEIDEPMDAKFAKWLWESGEVDKTLWGV